MNLSVHTVRQYDERLKDIRDKISLMGAHVVAMIASTARALTEPDVALAQRTIAQDDVLDRFEREIDESCMVLLATRSPMGSDLRFVTTAMKIAVELERAGDLAVGACERVVAFDGSQPLMQSDQMLGTSEQVVDMLRDALEAFVHGDAYKAGAVFRREPRVDEGFARLFDQMLEWMAQDAQRIPRGAQVQSIAKRFERMADHATNIARLVLDMLDVGTARVDQRDPG